MLPKRRHGSASRAGDGSYFVAAVTVGGPQWTLVQRDEGGIGIDGVDWSGGDGNRGNEEPDDNQSDAVSNPLGNYGGNGFLAGAVVNVAFAANVS